MKEIFEALVWLAPWIFDGLTTTIVLPLAVFAVLTPLTIWGARKLIGN